MTNKEAYQRNRDEAIRNLKKYLPRKATVYTILRHVSKSGMQRRIDVFAIKNNQLWYVSGYVGQILGYKFKGKNPGLVINGCGMDMGYHITHSLSRELYGEGYQFGHEWI